MDSWNSVEQLEGKYLVFTLIADKLAVGASRQKMVVCRPQMVAAGHLPTTPQGLISNGHISLIRIRF